MLSHMKVKINGLETLETVSPHLVYQHYCVTHTNRRHPPAAQNTNTRDLSVVLMAAGPFCRLAHLQDADFLKRVTYRRHTVYTTPLTSQVSQLVLSMKTRPLLWLHTS